MTAAHGNENAIDKPNETGQIIRRLLSYMVTPKTRLPFGVATVARIVALAGLMVLPFVTGKGINVISEGGTKDELVEWVIWGVIAAAVYLVFSFAADRTFARLATQGLYLLQTHLFSHLQTLSMGFFYSTPVGELLSRVNNDAEGVAQFYENAVAQLLRAILMLLMLLIVMLLISVTLTFVALLIVPIILVVMFVITRVSSPAFAELQEKLGETSGFQEETLAGHRVVISKRRQDWADGVNEAHAAGAFEVGSKAWFTSLLQFPFTQSLTYIQIVLVYVVGALMVVDGSITVGVVIAFAGYVALMASPLSQISNLLSTTLNAVAGGRRIFEVLDTKPTVVDAPDAKDYEFKGWSCRIQERRLRLCAGPPDPQAEQLRSAGR